MNDDDGWLATWEREWLIFFGGQSRLRALIHLFLWRVTERWRRE